MSNTFGNIFKITTFGESHGTLLGVTIDGLWGGIKISQKNISDALDERKPSWVGSTERREKDEFEIVSGLFEGKTTGAPLTIIIKNTDARPQDYESLKNTFRDGHGDKSWLDRYGYRDYRGGGRLSGRETVSRVVAGAIAMQILNTLGISIKTKIISIHGDYENFDNIIKKAMEMHDSVGGRIKCTISGVEAGIGEPVFDKLDAVLSHAIMSIGAVKGIEFGSGFHSEFLYGSENDKIENAGGILGGISNGQDIIFNVAVKPTPTINSGKRHDTCIVLRIGAVIKAMAAITILDYYLIKYSSNNLKRYFKKEV